jgi:hypothetical protein
MRALIAPGCYGFAPRSSFNMPPVQLALRTPVSSTSVTVITPGAGCAINPAATVWTAGATRCLIRRPASFFTGARLGLALATVSFVAFAAFDGLRAFGPAVAPFLICTFDCFLRLAMINPLVCRNQKTIGQVPATYQTSYHQISA